MRDVIQKIVAAETEAKRIVEEARAEGERIVSDAQKEGQGMVESARREALAEAGKIVAAAVEGTESEKERSLSRAAVEMEQGIQFEKGGRDSLAEGVVRCVSGLQ